MTNPKPFWYALLLATMFLWSCRPPIRFPSIKVPIPEKPTSRPVGCPEPPAVRVAR